MTDLEITKLCAEAMGYTAFVDDVLDVIRLDYRYGVGYSPLRNDAEAMALVKKFKMQLTFDGFSRNWYAKDRLSELMTHAFDLNRAVCECVAQMQLAKQKVAA